MKKPAVQSRGVYCILLTITLLLLSAFGVHAGESSLFDYMIEETALRYSVDPLLIKAIIWRESKFKPRTVGASGEIGLMQLKMLAVEDWANANGKKIPDPEDVFTPKLNIEIGTWFFARALERWNDHPRKKELALAEYNAGRTGLLRAIRNKGGDVLLALTTAPFSTYVQTTLGKHQEYQLEQDQRSYASASAASVDLTFNGDYLQ